MTADGDDLAPLKKVLGDLLAARRATAGLTQVQLARAISYGRTTVATAESGHRQPAAGFWTACDEVLGADGDLIRAYGQLAAARQRRSEQRVQVARSRRGVEPKVNPSGVSGIRRGIATTRSGGAGSALATVTARDSRALDTAAHMTSGLAVHSGGAEVGVTAIAGGRFFDGAVVQTLTVAAVDDGTLVKTVPATAMDIPLHGSARWLMVSINGRSSSGRSYGLDVRAVRRVLRRAGGGSVRVATPRAYELDDLALGMLWATANLDESLLGDDALLDRHRRHSAGYELLDRSAAALEEADGLSTVSRMWLGSDFCARHITRHSAALTGSPTFWTREQTGEAASAWLLFAHKYDYLQQQADRFGAAGQLRRAFCIPPEAVTGSPRWERVLLLLAVALMESFGVRTEVIADPDYAAVEGFVLDEQRRAIVANWVDAAGVWQVDVTSQLSVLREYADITGNAAARSVTAATTSAGRVRAFADYLGLDWNWLTSRCAELGECGTAGLIEPRSRLLSTIGVDRACRYVGDLRHPDALYAATGS